MTSLDSQKNKNVTLVEYVDEGRDYITATIWIHILKAVGIAYTLKFTYLVDELLIGW